MKHRFFVILTLISLIFLSVNPVSADDKKEGGLRTIRLGVPYIPNVQFASIYVAQEKGFYNGFSNEGLWPLCHIAHTRPVFRSEDWEDYADVNATFAKAVHEELLKFPDADRNRRVERGIPQPPQRRSLGLSLRPF